MWSEGSITSAARVVSPVVSLCPPFVVYEILTLRALLQAPPKPCGDLPTHRGCHSGFYQARRERLLLQPQPCALGGGPDRAHARLLSVGILDLLAACLSEGESSWSLRLLSESANKDNLLEIQRETRYDMIVSSRRTSYLCVCGCATPVARSNPIVRYHFQSRSDM